jgi:hypothetical protein
VFDDSIQCKAASIDTAVCADVSDSDAEVKMQSVVPWLGGDYNPWEACDTSQTGGLVNGEYANEEIESSCHPLICRNGAAASYYKNHPTNEKYRLAPKSDSFAPPRKKTYVHKKMRSAGVHTGMAR